MHSDANDLLDRLSDSVTVYDRSARLLFMNAAAERPFARPRSELLGQRPWDLVAPGPRTPFRDALEAILADGTPRTVVSYVATIERWYEVDLYPHPSGALAVARDVTAREKAGQQLRESERRFRAMVEHAPEAIVIVNMTTERFVEVNGAAERLFGRTTADLLTLGPLLVSPEMQPSGAPSAQAMAAHLRLACEGGSADFEWTLAGPAEQPVVVDVHVRRLPSTDPILLRASLFDISARKRAQDQLAQMQRLEAVARLAGGVAHDFNNMLTVILSGTQLVLGDLSPSDPARKDLANVVNAAERAALVTRQLLAFGRQQDVSPRVIDLSTYVERMQPVLERLLGEDVELELDLARPLGGVRIDPAHVEQILLNLVANARDAMPGGGRLTIHTANVLLDGEYQRNHNGVPPGRYVMLSVADTGEGIPETVKPHIFEPFFTTKALSRGTGLGLATVYGIVQQNQGHIWVYSEPQMGATFKVYLPLVDSATALTSEAPPAADAYGGSETILLVEDEDRVRQTVRRALQRAGYTVLEARNAGEALLIFEQHEGLIHLMLTDVVMPRMTGPQLAARLRALRADLPVLYMSGYSEDRVEAQREGGPHEGFIAKPIALDALLRGIREILDRHAGRAKL